MRFTSLVYLRNQAWNSLTTFPLTILSGLIASLVGIYHIENELEIINSNPFINTYLTAILGIALFFCIKIISLKHQLSWLNTWIWRMVGLGLLLLFYFSMPYEESTLNSSVPYYRFALYNVILHLLISFAPFLGNGELNGFWQYNKKLFLRFLASLLYAICLYLGISLAIFALNELFNADFESEIYGQLFIFIIGVFNTWFFVSGVPTKLDELDGIQKYPKGLKVFTQFVLFPLLLIYISILYIYAGKIFLSGEWPEGLVTYLVIFVGVLGILCVLLMYPYGKKEGNKWMKVFSRFYYVALIPLVILLFYAIGLRVNQYGMTVNRFIISLIACWLGLISIYYALDGRNIKLIPISLATVLFFFSFGSWSMFRISEKSQIRLLQELLEENDILEEDQLTNEVIWQDSSSFASDEVPNAIVLSDSVYDDLESIITYLDKYHGVKGIKYWFTQNLDSMLRAYNKNKSKYSEMTETRAYIKSMGIQLKQYAYVQTRITSVISYHTFYGSKGNLVQVKGYEYAIPLSISFRDNTFKPFWNDDDTAISILRDPAMDNQILVRFNYSDSDTVAFNFNPMLLKLFKKYKETNNYVNAEELSILQNTRNQSLKLNLRQVQTRKEKDTVQLWFIRGDLLWKDK